MGFKKYFIFGMLIGLFFILPADTTAVLWKKGVDLSGSDVNMVNLQYCDEASGNLIDSSGYQLNLTARGTETYGDAGVFQKSISINGQTGNFFNETTYNAQFRKPNSFGIGAWVRHLFGGSTDVIASTYYANDGYSLQMDSTGKVQSVVYNSTGAGGLCYSEATEALTDEKFHRVWMVVNSSMHVITYIDGKYNASVKCTGNVNYGGYNDFKLGTNGQANRNWNGSIDSFTYFNSSSILTPEYILNDYMAAITELNGSIDNSMIGYYNLSATVGFGDNTTSDVWLINTTGQAHKLLDSSNAYPTSNEFVMRVNNTHWNVWVNGTNTGTLNMTLNATGGNALITNASKYFAFSVSELNSNFNISLKSNIPDIDSFNLFSQSWNVTYLANASSRSNSVVNNNTVNLCYNVNESLIAEASFLNGTRLGYPSTCINQTSTKVNNIYEWYNSNVGDNIYPIIENLPYTSMNTPHTSSLTISTINDEVLEYFWGVKPNIFVVLEFMANYTGTATGNLNIYYANSTCLSNPGTLTLANGCVQVGSVAPSNVYNHTHGSFVGHKLIVMSASDGKINTVPVTNQSGFIFKGSTPQTATWSLWGVNEQTRADTTRSSINNGGTWTNQPITLDSHLHIYNESYRVNWFVTLRNQSGYGFNSSLSWDYLNLTQLPPTDPSVYLPLEQIKLNNTRLDLNYTLSSDPNLDPINQYNITLWDISGAFITTLSANNTPNTGYPWTTYTYFSGNLRFGVQACNSLCSNVVLSNNFTIYETIKLETCQIPPYTLTNTAYNLKTYVWNRTFQPDKVWFTDGIAGAAEAVTTPTPPNGLNTLTFDTTGRSLGSRTVYCYVNDSMGNTANSTNTTYIYEPLSLTSYAINETYARLGSPLLQTITLSVNPFIDTVYCKYAVDPNAPSIISNKTAGVGGANNILWITTGLTTVSYNTRGCANDSFGGEVCSVGTIQVRFYTTTTTIPVAPFPSTNATYNYDAVLRPCLSKVKQYDIFHMALCPFEQSWGMISGVN